MNSEEPSFTSFSPPVNSNSSTVKTSSTTPHHLRSSQTSLTTVVKAQISFLLSILSADNYDNNVAGINSLLVKHGQDTYFHLLRRLLIDNQSRICNIGTRSSELHNHSLSYRLLIEKVVEAASDPSLSAVFCKALNSIDHSDSFKDLDLNSFLEHVGINPVEKVGLCISLLSANRKEIVEQAREIIRQNFDPLVKALGDQSIQANLSEKLLHHLIAYYKSYEAESRSLSSTQGDTSTNALKSKTAFKPVPFALLLNSNQTVPTADFPNMSESSDQSRAILSKTMQDLGYNCCSSASAFRNVLNQLEVTSAESGEIIREDDVAQAIGMMAITHTNLEDGSAWNQPTDSQERKQTWDIEVFVSTLMELQPHLDWVKIIEKLDYPEFNVHDTKGLEIILSSFRKAVKDRQQFPLHTFWGRWKNFNGQFNFLRRMVQASPEVFNINDYPFQKVLSMEDFATSNANLKSMSGMLTANPWNSVELIETMIKMADTDLFEEVRQLFERAAKQTPEVMCLGLAQIQKPWNSLHQEIVNRLVSMFLTGHSSSTPVLTRLWQVNSKLFIEGCLEMYKKDAMTISRILDIAQDLKILSPLLAVQPFSFSIDLAALASRREYLNLEKWLQDNISEFGDSFIHDCLAFLSQKIAMEVTRESNSNLQSVRLTSDVFAIFLRILSNSSMSQANSELFKEINKKSVHVYPRLLTSISAEGNVSDQTFTPDVEEEANSYYERVYRQEISIEDFIKLLQKFKHSDDNRENQIFSCMVHNLFDEYQFFPKYPQRELTITSVIFGSLIQYQLVIYEALGIALRYVLNALRSPADSRMFNFGVQALSQFQSRLPEWPQYCSQVLQITQLQQSHPEIVQYVRSTLALNSNKNMPTAAIVTSSATAANSSSSGNIEPPTSKATTNNSNSNINSNNKPVSEQNNKVIDRPAFTALNLDTLLAADKVDYEVPSEAVQDKILFIINNVAQSNLETKVAEMKDILKESHYRWFANYLVVKRASIEPNYHQLYLQFLESLESQSLCRHVLHETFANIKVLLNSEKTVQSSSERSLLKNLGSWLGGMTLSKNKPIKHKNIAFKELLVEGYDSNRLIVAIPFVCKVLEQASKSKVFKPPNPWLMAILKLLVELYQSADLKLNLKFEIEVLCKSLEIELKDIEPTTILKDRPQKEIVANQTEKLAQEFDKWPPTGKLPSQSSQGPISSAQTVPIINNNNTLSLSDEPVTNLGSFITINPNLPIFANQGLRKLVHLAMDRAIREIITPVVERSVTIAGISTRELIIKDFAMEPNEEKMRNSAHLMVQNLAGSLALVTCKEPLRISMVTHLRNLLLSNGFSEQSISEQAILIVVADNLDLACSFIEKAAMDKAVPEIDDSLASSFSNRKKHRERTGQPYYDMSVYSGISRYMGNLPEPLRLKPNGLLPQQLKVYEDFARIPRLSNQAADIYTDRSVRPGILRGQDFGVGHLYNSAEMQFDGPQVQIPITLEKFGQYLTELDKLISKSPNASFASLPPNHDIRLLVKEIPLLATQSFNRDETALHFSQKVVQLLYKNDSNLSREIYVILLEKLCEISYKVNKEVTAWLIYADDERKFIVPVVVALIKAGLINVMDQDTQLAKLIENGRPTVIDFTAKLIRECVLRDPPCAKRSDFVSSLDALTRLTQRGKSPEAVIQLLEDLRPRASREVLSSKDVENAGLRDQLTYFFAEWVRVYQHPTSNEKTYASFIVQLQQHGVLKGEEISSMFFRVCTEMSVDHYLKQKATAQTTPVIAYQAIDAFSKLIVLLVKYHSDPEGINNNNVKINYLTKILSIIVLVLAQAHEQRRQQFNQKPFFRLFSSLLNDLNSYEQQLQPIYFQILTALSNNTFHTLQPMFLPGFTFAWLSLISHRLFMPKLLLAEDQKGWPSFHKLLICLFKFLVPFLRNVEMIDTTRLLYKGTLRVLLVLLHDFPEFLCDYHFSFCDVIPSSCIQLRNLILSAFPRNMRLPDPFTPNLKVDLLPEISQSPRVLSDYASALVANNLKNDIDNYLKTRSPISFPSDLKQKLLFDSNDQREILSTGSKYNVPIINALVLYVGIQAISQLHNKSAQGITHSAPMDIFQQLLIDLDSEGRYLFLSAIANQLRYPNSHTHYFSCILLYLFAEGNQEVIKEQVTRVLLERLIVNRPHPWGLLITFIELIKNPRYNFWSHSFTRCAADIERLFDSVSRSINQV